jgi:hypothetical protein
MRALAPLLVAFVAAVGPARAQEPASARVRAVLERTVRVESPDGRFLLVEVDSLPASADGAALVNGRRRLYEYLVQHQVPPPAYSTAWPARRAARAWRSWTT